MAQDPDKQRRRAPSPLDANARATTKDALRVMRQGLRSSAQTLLEGAPRSPSLSSHSGSPMRATVGELLTSMDRFLGRTERAVSGTIAPGRGQANPGINADHMLAVLKGTASAHLVSSFLRHLRHWLQMALHLEGIEDAVVLERRLRDLWHSGRINYSAAPSTSIAHRAAQLLRALHSAQPIRFAHKPGKDASAAYAVTVIAILAAATNKRRATLDPRLSFRNAKALLISGTSLDMPTALDDQALANELQRLAEML